MHLAIRFLAGSARQQTAAQGELAHDSRRAVRTARADAVPGVRVLELCCTDGDKAQSQDFAPFWEFISGPLHAGTFGPNDLDMTFGPEVKYVKAPTEEQGANLPPSAGLQFFGLVDIDGATQQMTVRLLGRADTELWSITLDPEGMAI